MMHLTAEDYQLLRQGLERFRAGDYFAAHDDWEEVWRGLRGRQRLFWQAMIQLAVGMVHWQNGNLKGCRSVWNKALQKCDAAADLYETDVPDQLLHLIAILDECLTAVHQGQNPTPSIARFATEDLSEDWFTVA
jgi:predicted metal-dependent hydrolase